MVERQGRSFGQTGTAGVFGQLPIVFDSSTHAERDRFAFAREEYGRKALKVDLETLGETPFRLRLRAQEYGDVRVALIDSTSLPRRANAPAYRRWRRQDRSGVSPRRQFRRRTERPKRDSGPG
jgi:hypothetical protein